jgi:hypothetical protein
LSTSLMQQLLPAGSSCESVDHARKRRNRVVRDPGREYSGVSNRNIPSQKMTRPATNGTNSLRPRP